MNEMWLQHVYRVYEYYCIICCNCREKHVENVDGEHFVGNTTVCAKFC